MINFGRQRCIGVWGIGEAERGWGGSSCFTHVTGIGTHLTQWTTEATPFNSKDRKHFVAEKVHLAGVQ